MKMIKPMPGHDGRKTCSDCHESYAIATGHACTAKKAR